MNSLNDKLSAFKFSPDFIGKNAGDFQSRLVARYGKSGSVKKGNLTKAEVDNLVNFYFKGDPGAKKLQEPIELKEDPGADFIENGDGNSNSSEG